MSYKASISCIKLGQNINPFKGRGTDRSEPRHGTHSLAAANAQHRVWDTRFLSLHRTHPGAPADSGSAGWCCKARGGHSLQSAVGIPACATETPRTYLHFAE
jgi:hypothetical protein